MFWKSRRDRAAREAEQASRRRFDLKEAIDEVLGTDNELQVGSFNLRGGSEACMIAGDMWTEHPALMLHDLVALREMLGQGYELTACAWVGNGQVLISAREHIVEFGSHLVTLQGLEDVDRYAGQLGRCWIVILRTS